MLMSGAEFRESLRRYKPVVYVSGQRVESVADAPQLAPGINAIALTYDYALRPEFEAIMQAQDRLSGATVNRMMHLPGSSSALLNKLEAVRLVCQETGCAQRYLGGDALSAIFQATRRMDGELGSEYQARVCAYLDYVYQNDLTYAIAMTDAKGDRSKRPYQQHNPDSYVHTLSKTTTPVDCPYFALNLAELSPGRPAGRAIIVTPSESIGSAQQTANSASCSTTPTPTPRSYSCTA